MPRIFAVLAATLIGLIIFSSCVFVVDQRQYAVVYALGEIKRVIEEPGLYFKAPAPLQNVVYMERRILTIDTPEAESFITSEKKNLLIDTYVKWRIVDPKIFMVSFAGDERRAQDRLTQIVKAALNEEITKRTIREVVSSERTKVMQTIVAKVADDSRQLGIDVVDVRLKRVDLKPEVSESVYRRMEAERKRVANELRSQGAAESERIRAEADREREVTLAKAYREAQTIKGEGDAKAASIYNAAFGQNPEFFAFYRSLEAYRQSFRTKSDIIMVDPQSDFLRYMRGSGGGKAGK
jgi:membrane protease subunit HflC